MRLSNDIRVYRGFTQSYDHLLTELLNPLYIFSVLRATTLTAHVREAQSTTELIRESTLKCVCIAMHNTMTATATLPVIPEGETKEDTSRPGNVTIGLEDANVGQADSFETPMDRRPSLIKGHSRWGVTRPHLLRESSTTVLQGGKEVLVEEVTNTRNAMDPVQRRASQFLGRYSTNQDEEDIETGAHKQYRLTSRRVSET
jgi:hypothetical protein